MDIAPRSQIIFGKQKLRLSICVGAIIIFCNLGYGMCHMLGMHIAKPKPSVGILYTCLKIVIELGS